MAARSLVCAFCRRRRKAIGFIGGWPTCGGVHAIMYHLKRRKARQRRVR